MLKFPVYEVDTQIEKHNKALDEYRVRNCMSNLYNMINDSLLVEMEAPFKVSESADGTRNYILYITVHSQGVRRV